MSAEPSPAPHRPPSSDQICAVIVSHHPDPEFPDRVRTVADQVGQTVIVDNGTQGNAAQHITDAAQLRDVQLIRNESNLGLAAALNQGLARAQGGGFRWAITFDQDSRATPDLVTELCRGFERLKQPEKTAILAPQVHDLGTGEQATYLRRRLGVFFQRTPCEGEVLEGILSVISSGALLRLPGVMEAGGFREDLFIDYVDTDLCLRLRRRGLGIAAVCQAILYHRLGRRRKLRYGPLTLLPTFHPPWRWYMISRNRIHVIRAHAMAVPHWLTYELTAALFTTIRMLLTEDQRARKARMIVKGTWDGLRGRSGPPPESVIKVDRSDEIE